MLFLACFHFHLLFSSASEFCFDSFLWFLSLCQPSHLVYVLFSWLLKIIFLCFLLAHWASSKELLLIFYQVNYRPTCLWGQLLEDYCNHLVASGFLDFSCSMKSCIAAFASEEAVTPSRLYWLTLVENYLPTALQGILKLVHTLSGYASSLFLLPLVADFLRFYAFSSSCSTPVCMLTVYLLFI